MPGSTVKDMNDIAIKVYTKYGYEKMYPGCLGHFVGMAVHDVGPYNKPFVPGVVFNVEPILEDKNMKLHIRLEDTIIITADGHENVTAGTTTDPEAMYKLVKEKGIGEK